MPRPRTTIDNNFRGPQTHRVADAMLQGLDVILDGPAGTGKTECADIAIERVRNGRPVINIRAHGGLNASDLLDRNSSSSLYKAMKEGAILFIDEANRLADSAWSLFLHAIVDRSLALPGESEELQAEEGFQVVMAINVGSDFNVQRMDPAIRDRFARIHFDYLTPGDEEELLVEKSGVSIRIARVMVAVANETRRLRKQGDLVTNLTFRGLTSWARVYEGSKRDDSTYWLQEAARTTWLNSVAGVDPDGSADDANTEFLENLISEKHDKHKTR